jgi:hypothetical protein
VREGRRESIEHANPVHSSKSRNDYDGIMAVDTLISVEQYLRTSFTPTAISLMARRWKETRDKDDTAMLRLKSRSGLRSVEQFFVFSR